MHRMTPRFPNDPESPCLWCGANYYEECRPVDSVIGFDPAELRVDVRRGLQPTSEPVFIIFDGPPSHESGRFVEVETESGHSVGGIEWQQREDGLWALGPFYRSIEEA